MRAWCLALRTLKLSCISVEYFRRKLNDVDTLSSCNWRIATTKNVPDETMAIPHGILYLSHSHICSSSAIHPAVVTKKTNSLHIYTYIFHTALSIRSVHLSVRQDILRVVEKKQIPQSRSRQGGLQSQEGGSTHVVAGKGKR